MSPGRSSGTSRRPIPELLQHMGHLPFEPINNLYVFVYTHIFISLFLYSCMCKYVCTYINTHIRLLLKTDPAIVSLSETYRAQRWDVRVQALMFKIPPAGRHESFFRE